MPESNGALGIGRRLVKKSEAASEPVCSRRIMLSEVAGGPTMGEFTFILSLMAVGLIAIGLCFGFLWIEG